MSHRFEKLKSEYQKAQEAIYSQASFKDWLSVTVITNIILVSICLVLYIFFRNDISIIVISIGLSLSVFFILVTFHEFLHGLVAQYYGYKYSFSSSTLFTVPKINRPFISLSIDVIHDSEKQSQWEKDRVMIALMPHFVMLPLGISFILVGYFTGILFFTLLGLLTTGGHLIALVLDVNVK